MWYVISGIIGFIILILMIKESYFDFGDIIGMFLTLLFIWAVTTGLLWFIASCMTNKVKTYEKKQYDIQGLENNISTSQETNGAFILGFGYINSNDKDNIKYYYFKVDELGKKLETLEITNYSDIYIRETDDTEPCLIYVYEETENNKFFEWLLGKHTYTNKSAEVLVVPKNTIKIEYNVEV